MAFCSLPAENIVASLFGCSGVCKKNSDSDVGKEEGKALASTANNEADRWRKTKRERLMTGNDDEKKKGEKEIVHFGL